MNIPAYRPGNICGYVFPQGTTLKGTTDVHFLPPPTSPSSSSPQKKGHSMTTPKNSSSIQSKGTNHVFFMFALLITSQPAVLSRYRRQEKSLQLRMTLLYSWRRHAGFSALLNELIRCPLAIRLIISHTPSPSPMSAVRDAEQIYVQL